MAEVRTRGRVPGSLAMTPSGDPVMVSKFRLPAIRQRVVIRERLFDRLSDGSRGPLTLISAPAGSGKSVLVSSWVSAGKPPGPAVWISLDEDDDRPGVFWTYVLAALARCDGLPPADVGVPQSAEVVDHSLLVRLAARLAEAAAPIVLVLDNVEVLTRQQIADELGFVVRHAAGQLRLIMITRVDPNLPLHTYRLEGSVLEIRFPELAFTADEATELLRGHDIDPTDSSVLAFAYRTRGWAAGLRLAGSSGGAGVAGLVESDIAAYFRAEVLDAQPPDVRDFLLSTSIVEHLPAELAVQLSGLRDAATTLRALAQANTFVERCPDEGDCFQYHPLVRDLLQAQLRRELAGRQRRLHRRAAHWLVEAGRDGDAVLQYAAAEDWQDAARALVRAFRVADLLMTPTSGAGLDVFSGMPVRTSGSAASLVVAALAWRRGDLTSCEKFLTRAEELLVQVEGEDLTATRVAISLLSGVLAVSCGDGDGALVHTSAANELLSELAARNVVPPISTRALALWCAGSAHLATGDLTRSREALSTAARTANAAGQEDLRARCLAQLALVEALSGRLVQASETAHRAVGVSERCKPSGRPRPAVADVALAWVSSEHGDSARARAHADAAVGGFEVLPDPNVQAVLALIRSRWLRARGELAAALAALDTGGRTLPPVRVPAWPTLRLSAAHASLLTTQGQPEGAIAELRRSGAIEIPEGQLAFGWAQVTDDPDEAMRAARSVLHRSGLPLAPRVEALLLAAAAELEAGQLDQVRASVARARALADPENLRRPFEEVPARLRAVLRSAGEARAGGPGAGGVSSRAPKDRRPVGDAEADVVIQPLTEREQEVLEYLAELLPTEEIAGRMFVSVNTVKTHVRAILRKLSVERRNDAVRRGRELGLV